jgi:hypothetical protein
MENRGGTAVKNMKAALIRKIIPLIAIVGFMGGATAAAMELAGTGNTYFMTGVYVLIYALTGTLAGYFLKTMLENRGKDPIARNFKGDLLRFKQPLYGVAAIAAVIAFITNIGTGVGAAVIAALFFGLSFALGISNGIFDYRESVNKNLLLIAILPIGFSFVYGYYMKGTDAASGMAWLYGSIYLFGYLLFLNRMQLNSIIFFRKAVNIEDSRKIRIYNDWLIILFYIVYLIMFNFRKILNVSWDAIMAVFGWFLVMMEKLISLLMAEPGGAPSTPTPEEEELDLVPTIERPWLEKLMRIAIYVILGLVAVAAAAFIIFLLVKLFKIIRNKLSEGFNNTMGKKKIEFAEYEEENEIVREEKNKDTLKARRKKMQYNLKKLNEIPLAGEKIRYVYGFVLERLYHKHVDIEESDTPDEILAKVKKHRNGEKLAKMGFEEFTRKYHKARYSDKPVEEDENLVETGEKFEKGISSIKVEEKKDNL